MLGVARIHPRGEDKDYDGLYFKRDELDRCAKNLRGLPVLFEHDSDPVGTVLHSYVGDEGDLFGVFETNNTTFGGAVCGSFISTGLVNEVSLGHECTIESSADGSQRVTKKMPTELSIVQKGARKGTQIFAKTKKNPAKRYINISQNNIINNKRKMTDTSAPQIPSADADSAMMKQLLEQVKLLTEKQALSSQENEALKEANFKFAAQVEESEAAGKRKRESVLDGSIKSYFAELMAKYETELKPHEEQLQGMMESMKSNSASEPMVQALACAARASKGSVTDLEASYQANKKMKTELDELKAKFTNQSTQMFAKKEERVEAQASASTDAVAKPASFSSIFGGPSLRTPDMLRGSGMRETNPKMWADLLHSAPKNSGGMPKIDAFMSMITRK